jgi:hypothetical protein
MLRIALAFSVALLLACCSRATFLVLCNNSGSVAEIVNVPDFINSHGVPHGSKTWSFPWTWRFLIQNGEAREIASNNGDSWYVQLRTRGCSLEYLVPASFQDFGPNGRAFPPTELNVRVQLESDLRLYLVPYNAPNVMRVEPLLKYQPAGFPASPVTNCPQLTHQ